MLVLAVFLIGAACSSGSDEATGVRPFSEIQESDFVFEVDPLDPDRGIFRVVTTEPAICAIVWGETEALGNFNNSLAMNGTGIVDHDVFLPGAVPGQTYFFRVQGSTADGTLYQSPLATFTLPEVPEGAAPEGSVEVGPNLALAGTISFVSSEFSDAWSASNAIDDDLSTEWSSRGDGDGAAIEVDLGSVQPIGGVEFVTRAMADGTAITTTYRVVVDGEATFGPFPAGSPAVARVEGLDIEGRVVRFEVVETTGGNTGAVEIRVFAPAS